MDNKNFPPLEPEHSMPEFLPDIPEQMEPLEDRPVIEELTFDAEVPASSEIPDEPQILELPMEESGSGDMSETEITHIADPAPVIIESEPVEIPDAEPLPAPAEFVTVEDILPELLEEIPELAAADDHSDDLSEIPASVPVEEIVDQEYRDDGQDFDTMMRAAAPQPETEKLLSPSIGQKGRPKRKKGEGLLGIPNLDHLEIGDTFEFSVLDRKLTYQVDQIKIVDPTDTADLLIQKDSDYATLLTCTPYGINTHRLLVRGRRIETISEKTITIKSDAHRIDPLIITPIVALPILFTLMIIVLLKPVKKDALGDDN